jgi:hypothetical protein
MRKQTSSRDVACFQLPKRQDANAQKTGETDGEKSSDERERERDKDPEKKHHPAHTRTRYKGGIEEEEEEKLFHSLLPPISLGEIWKLHNSTISSLPRFLLFYCSSIYFGCCRREHRSIQMMMKYPQDFNSTLLIVFDAARHSKKKREQRYITRKRCRAKDPTRA